VNRLFENAGFSEKPIISYCRLSIFNEDGGIESSPGNIGLIGGSHYSE